MFRHLERVNKINSDIDFARKMTRHLQNPTRHRPPKRFKKQKRYRVVSQKGCVGLLKTSVSVYSKRVCRSFENGCVGVLKTDVSVFLKGVCRFFENECVSLFKTGVSVFLKRVCRYSENGCVGILKTGVVIVLLCQVVG